MGHVLHDGGECRTRPQLECLLLRGLLRSPPRSSPSPPVHVTFRDRLTPPRPLGPFLGFPSCCSWAQWLQVDWDSSDVSVCVQVGRMDARALGPFSACWPAWRFIGSLIRRS